MNDTTQSLVRNIAQAAAGALLAKGAIDAKSAEIIPALAVSIFVAVWGWLHQRQHAIDKAQLPPQD